MKLKLLTLLSLFSLSAFAQTAIANFDSAPMSNYAIVNSTLAMDQSTAGANVTWTFNDLATTASTNDDTYATPTSGELSTYPGTTSVLTTTTSPSSDVAKVYTAEDLSGNISYTGIIAQGLTLNFNADNALIVNLPANYTDSNSDTSSGAFIYQSAFGPVGGSFTGTIDTEVDGHGTLIMNDVGAGAFNGSVTRLKVVQDLDLTLDEANVVQTTYNYYDDSNGNLVFRFRNVTIISNSLINDSITIIESLLSSTLETEKNIVSEANFVITQNPVKDYLKFNTESNLEIESISILDLGGRLIFKTEVKNNSVLVDTLKSGIYIITAETNQGLISRKFIKE